MLQGLIPAFIRRAKVLPPPFTLHSQQLLLGGLTTHDTSSRRLQAAAAAGGAYDGSLPDGLAAGAVLEVPRLRLLDQGQGQGGYSWSYLGVHEGQIGVLTVKRGRGPHPHTANGPHR